MKPFHAHFVELGAQPETTMVDRAGLPLKLKELQSTKVSKFWSEEFRSLKLANVESSFSWEPTPYGGITTTVPLSVFEQSGVELLNSIDIYSHATWISTMNPNKVGLYTYEMNKSGHSLLGRIFCKNGDQLTRSEDTTALTKAWNLPYKVPQYSVTMVRGVGLKGEYEIKLVVTPHIFMSAGSMEGIGHVISRNEVVGLTVNQASIERHNALATQLACSVAQTR